MAIRPRSVPADISVPLPPWELRRLEPGRIESQRSDPQALHRESSQGRPT